MLCLQNIGNLYRKNAFKRITFVDNEKAKAETTAAADFPTSAAVEELGVATMSQEEALKVFDEAIDFSLEAGVPDPLPFEKKLRSMLEAHEAFLLPEQHKIGHRCVVFF
jgi:hypothetical protein